MRHKYITGLIVLLIRLSIPGTILAKEQNGIDSGATAWMLTSTTLVLLMVPGLAMLYLYCIVGFIGL
jgi:Amt family ammonium transporter